MYLDSLFFWRYFLIVYESQNLQNNENWRSKGN